MASNSKTLVILIPGFPENEADTTCLPPLQLLVRSLNKVFPGLKVVVVAFHYPFFTHTYQWHGNTIISMGGKYRNKIHLLHSWWKIWRQLKKLRQQHDIAGLFSCWCGPCALIGHYFGKRYNIKHHTWLLGQDAKKSNNTVRYMRPAPQELIAISDFLVQEFNRNHHIKPQHVIPIGVNTADFPPVTAPVDIDILGVGNLVPLKQYEIFIEVIHAVKQHFPNIKTGICGKGTEVHRLQALIAQWGLQDNVQLYGEQLHREVLRLMQRSRILLHPSSYEGFGMVMLEALYAGAQVVSFVQPMQAAIPNWYIVKDKAAMVEQVLTLLRQPPAQRQAVLPYEMNGSASAIMQLFGYNEAMTS